MSEATMVVLDTTEYMRNCDYFPSRLGAEQEAAIRVFQAKMNDNPQNSIGLMTLSGTVKASFVSHIRRFQAGVNDTKIDNSGDATLSKAIQVAQLALRHRQPNQGQRIIAFIGSPINDSEQELKKLALRLKKNRVSVDVVTFGQEGENSKLLAEFVATLQTSEHENSSHFVDVPAGVDELADGLLKDKTTQWEDAMDMDDDPELMMALRMSLEEEKQRVLAESANQ